MKNETLELVFILDKSGSMQPLTDDTIGGFNANIEKYREEEGEALVTTVLFDTECTMTHDRIPISEVPMLTRREYAAGGCTALNDAVGRTVEHIEKIHRYIRPEDVPGAVLFIIMTDGMENASRSWSTSRVRDLVAAKKEAGWDFVFIGAGIDAFREAENIGISSRASRRVERTSAGMGEAMCNIARTMDYSRRKARGEAPFATVEEFLENEEKEGRS